MFDIGKCSVVCEVRQHWSRPPCWICFWNMRPSHSKRCDCCKSLGCIRSTCGTYRMLRAISSCTCARRFHKHVLGRRSMRSNRMCWIRGSWDPAKECRCSKLHSSRSCTNHKRSRSWHDDRKCRRSFDNTFRSIRRNAKGSLKNTQKTIKNRY